MSAPSSVIYQIRQVTQRREAGGAVFSLLIPEMTLHTGEFIVFLGESGCGKSTLLDMLGLVARPTSADCFEMRLQGRGTVNLMNSSETGLAGLRRKHLGYVLQRGGLLPFLTAGENVALACRLNGEKRPQERVKFLMNALHIEEHRHKKPALLSGGQRQRVALARALAHQPAILLADEPTGAVDKHTAREVRDLLRQATKSFGTTVLMVTHDEALMAHASDRVFTFDVNRVSESEVSSTLRETSWQTRTTKTP